MSKIILEWRETREGNMPEDLLPHKEKKRYTIMIEYTEDVLIFMDKTQKSPEVAHRTKWEGDNNWHWSSSQMFIPDDWVSHWAEIGATPKFDEDGAKVTKEQRKQFLK